MKKLAKNLLVGTLALSTAFSATACAGGGGTSSDTLTIGRWGTPSEQALYESFTEKFTEETGIKVEWKWGSSYDSYFTGLTTGFASNKNDIIFINSTNYVNVFTSEDASSAFVNFNDITELSDEVASLFPEGQNSFKSTNGDKLALPIGTVTKRLVVNNADFATAETAVPTDLTKSFTFETLSELLVDVVDKVQPDSGAVKYGTIFDQTELLYTLCASVDAPVVAVAEDGTKSVGLDNEAGEAVLLAMRNFYMNLDGSNDNMHPNLATAEQNKDSALESNLAVAGYYGAHKFPTLEKDFDFTTLPGVIAEGGKETMLVDYNAVMINKRTKLKDEAVKFVEWMLAEAQQLELASFADLPSVKSAFDKVVGGTLSEFPSAHYAGFAVGSENIYVKPATSSDFNGAMTLAMTTLLEKSLEDTDYATDLELVKGVIADLVDAEQYLN